MPPKASADSYGAIDVDIGETIGVMEQVLIGRRVRPKRHFTLTSNVIIFGYRSLTDAEKLTYQAVDSFDWPDPHGKRKGYAYPSIRTLAQLRGIAERTIQRHLARLEEVGLLVREVRPGRTSLLWVEEPAESEVARYLALVEQRDDTKVTPDAPVTVPPDIDVTRRKDEDIKKKKSLMPMLEQTEAGAPTSIAGEIAAKNEWLTREMLAVLKDDHSLGYYRKAAANVSEHRVFEALSEVKQAVREGRIRTNRGAMFVSLLGGRIESRK
jgi:DNA-binding MarR family transcriptional regulator